MTASGYLNGTCGMRMLAADGTEQVVEYQTPQTYFQCSPLQPPDGLGFSTLDQCPICLQPCSYDEGDHKRVCLASCGHVFCQSCIKRWIEHRKAKAKCPTCNKKCKCKDVVKIYASPVSADDQVNAQTRVKELEAENASLRTEKASLMHIGKLSEITYNEQQEVIKELMRAKCMRQQV
ncbi:hypothetical protein ACLB2K_077102 [Fragaria x ananassa]